MVAVAVIAGLVWWLVRHDGGPGDVAAPPSEQQQEEPDPLTSGEFHYQTAGGPLISDDCVANSYGKVVAWFENHPCKRVSRALYAVEHEGARALVSVVLVTMPSANEAQQLKLTTDTDGTGNINDLIRDETVTIPDAPNVAQGEYASKVEDTDVIIVEAAFFGDHDDADLLARIGSDALRLGPVLR
ncbi:hypothetical protein BAY61_10345 [Prauserella marina]|nr:hypothetical protein BAY61_10345 [Prauserella marina]